MGSLNDHRIRVQDKDSRFVLLSNEEYCKKVQHQINRISFTLLSSDPRKTFEDIINARIEKWIPRKAIDENWIAFIKLKNVKPDKIYGIIKTHKESNPARIIVIMGNGAAVKNLSIFVNSLFPEVLKIFIRIQDTQHMLNIIDVLNWNQNLHKNYLLVSFDVVNIFPSIGNKMGIESMKNILLSRDNDIPPIECIFEALDLCLNYSKSIFNNQNY